MAGQEGAASEFRSRIAAQAPNYPVSAISFGNQYTPRSIFHLQDTGKEKCGPTEPPSVGNPITPEHPSQAACRVATFIQTRRACESVCDLQFFAKIHGGQWDLFPHGSAAPMPEVNGGTGQRACACYSAGRGRREHPPLPGRKTSRVRNVPRPWPRSCAS